MNDDKDELFNTNNETDKIKELKEKYNVPDLSYLLNGDTNTTPSAKDIVDQELRFRSRHNINTATLDISDKESKINQIRKEREQEEQAAISRYKEEIKLACSSTTISSTDDIHTNPTKTSKPKNNKPKKKADTNKLINETEHCAKLKRPIVERLLKEVNSKALMLLIHMARFQNGHGIVNGVDYKYYSDLLKISYTTFYSCLKELSDKEFIEYEKEPNCKTRYKVRIIGNRFAGIKKSSGVSYLSLNIEMFINPTFLTLSVLKQKLLIWSQLNIGGSASKFKKKGRTILRENLAEQLGITSYSNLDRNIRELYETGFYMGKKVECPNTGDRVRLEIYYVEGDEYPHSKIVKNRFPKNKVGYIINEINIVKNEKSELDFFLSNKLSLLCKINKFNIIPSDEEKILRLGHQFKRLSSDEYLGYCILSYQKFGGFEKKYVCKCCSNLLKIKTNNQLSKDDYIDEENKIAV